MLTLCDICEYIKERADIGDNIAAGVLPEKCERFIGVYDNNRSNFFRLALGGLENTKYRRQKITILIHWGRTADGAMKKAREIYEIFSGKCGVQMENTHIAFFTAYEPQSIGFTADKIYEYAVPVDIYINKED